MELNGLAQKPERTISVTKRILLNIEMLTEIRNAGSFIVGSPLNQGGSPCNLIDISLTCSKLTVVSGLVIPGTIIDAQTGKKANLDDGEQFMLTNHHNSGNLYMPLI
ncbi:hypothetical protein GWI33_021065 [Rhynchophorus ferrugineus]|uniref:Uncharacterized protein n=1 Tax=Rhynchophorus ferrugineus TaxID=354439 RepID=A0A834M3L9_RHYFE|nr:hypothetical protein GWI33_021065 [Rhynchophorus ferrugineus]